MFTWFYYPKKVFVVSLVILGINGFLSGSFYHLWALNRDQRILETQSQNVLQQIKVLEEKIQRAKDPVFLQREALDRYDYVSEKDLIFLFSDDEEIETEKN